MNYNLIEQLELACLELAEELAEQRRAERAISHKRLKNKLKTIVSFKNKI